MLEQKSVMVEEDTRDSIVFWMFNLPQVNPQGHRLSFSLNGVATWNSAWVSRAQTPLGHSLGSWKIFNCPGGEEAAGALEREPTEQSRSTRLGVKRHEFLLWAECLYSPRSHMLNSILNVMVIGGRAFSR